MSSSVVQATCPGCKKTLRIPADWIQQSIRCKYCGLVMQAKTASAPVPGGRAAPPPLPTAKRPTAPPALPKAVAAVHARAATNGGDPFADLDVTSVAPNAPPARRRRQSGFSWKGPAIVLVLLMITGTAVALSWSRLAALFAPSTGTSIDDSPNEDPKNLTISGSPGSPRSTAGETNPLPRRALVISLHNYLYANPIHFGSPDANTFGTLNILGLISKLNNVLHIPKNQIAYLSDLAPGKEARPPLKAVVQQTITGFLTSSRSQDRILLLFVGHSVEIDDQLYLVPIEGELKNPDKSKLIPLTWLYDELNKCKARQKVLILDINRFNPTGGVERPISGALSAKGEQQLKNPPPGVQVWSSCSKEQESYETDRAPMGVFLERLAHVLSTPKEQGGYQGTITRGADPLPIVRLNELLDASIKKDLSTMKLAQTPFVAGKEPVDGAAFDPKEPPAPPAVVSPGAAALVGGEKNAQLVKSVLSEIGTPPVKSTKSDNTIRFEALPPFDPRRMEAYAAPENKESEFQKAIHEARVILWSLTPGLPPMDLKADVEKYRKENTVNIKFFTEGYRADANETAFKKRIEGEQYIVAKILKSLEDAESVLKKAEPKKAQQPKRWQVNFDFMQARVDAQYAYVMEYQSKLGEMRKEIPPRDPNTQAGWKLAAQEKITGDPAGRKRADKSIKTYERIAKENAGTPWEVLAKREMLTTLGMQWKASSNP